MFHRDFDARYFCKRNGYYSLQKNGYKSLGKLQRRSLARRPAMIPLWNSSSPIP